MPSTTRTFLAVDLPGPLKAQLGRLEQRLAPDAPGVRWVDPGQCHVTLAFLGDVPDERLDALADAVARAAGAFTAFEVVLEGLGAFPNASRPRVVWAGLVGAQVAELRRLHEAVSRAAGAAGCPPADERFAPHVTIGRVKARHGPPPDLTTLLHRHRGWSGGPVAVDAVVTFASVLAPTGPTYTALAHAPLAAQRG